MEGKNYNYYGRGGSGGSSGRGRGRGGNDRENNQNYRGRYQYHDGAGRGRGRGTHVGGGDNRSPVPVPVPVPVPGPSGGGRGAGGRGEPYQKMQQPPSGGGGGGGVGPVGRGVWSGRPWGPSPYISPSPSPSSPSSSSSTSQVQYQPRPEYQRTTQRPHQSPSDPAQLNVQSMSISDQKPLSSEEILDNRNLPMKRPDRGTLAVRSVSLLANHFPVTFNPRGTIIHYDVDVKQVMPGGNQPLRRSIPKPVMSLIKDKLFSDESKGFPMDMVSYDGNKNIFSYVLLPTGEFKVELSDGEDTSVRTYMFTIKVVNQLKLSKLKEYMCGNLSYTPRDIMQAMDLVMKENPSKHRIPAGRGFYSKSYQAKDDLRHGIAAYRGFQQSLKPTSQGLALCLDYSVLAFRKPLPVIDFLKENIEGFRGVDDITRMKRQVFSALKGLKVRVTHRKTNQKYTISGLTTKNTCDITFPLVDPDGQVSSSEVSIVDYFWQKYEKNIVHRNIPSLDLGKPNKINYVPMEFCVLVEGQRYGKEELERNERDAAIVLKKISLAFPEERKSTICQMVQAEDGPNGVVAKNFEMGVEKNMTSVEGRVLGAPQLKLGAKNPVIVDQEKCQWNLVGKSVAEGKSVERWALIDFTSYSRSRLRREDFVNNLMHRAWKLGMHMEEPLVCHSTGMKEFSSVARIGGVLRQVIADADARRKGSLQIIVCVMAEKDQGYKYLKWVSETQIGVVTQCCLSFNANKGQDQYLANLCLKINAKLGGSNVELIDKLPNFVDEDYVMFIGADVNHPAARNSTCPSIAAVVGTINWPTANRYAARVQPQEHRKEKIVNFGSICRDLIDTYAKLNKIRPKKIVVFRDGVSEGQFDMVLNEELLDLKRAIYEDHYQPTITLVVAQKRHHTRLFLEGRRDRGVSGNIPPGTVVDTKIVHPFEFDFYLCSHYGSLGTSKPTHYYVLWDENAFTSDKLQKLIYNMCFTYSRCTKPVSLVPPVYYADLVAYRGRMFQEVLMEQSPASSVSSSSSAASFDQNFYTSHPDLQNVMYFV